MPDILIRGMEMPTDCAQCKVKHRQEYGEYLHEDAGWCCPFVGRIDDGDCIAPIDNRHPDCPLNLLPPHGDLIDRDALMADGWMDLHKIVVHMGGCAVHYLPLKNPTIPVVVPADKEETE